MQNLRKGLKVANFVEHIFKVFNEHSKHVLVVHIGGHMAILFYTEAYF